MGEDDERYREVAVDPEILERLADDAAAWAPESGCPKPGDAAEGEREAAIGILALIIETRLTERQREVVDLYFYRGKTQAEIAVILGISQQVVSKQLFGAMRKGKRVGGAIGKLRKLLRESGIDFE